jgi:Cdc6-like AAA superfamily ATPase/predicted Ser/Thr protein kinase/tetratricopeptide (TPR) repeat protein
VTQTPDQHRRLRAIFDEALLKEPSARAEYVDHACARDPEVGSEVMRLLAAHDKATSFLKHPPSLLSAVLAEGHFPGTGRFRVMRRLGAGGMGVVYEVHDRVRDEVVALKTLLRTSAADLYRLKREFRSLADMAHPNLVCLYELFVEEERCFFTMELVRGMSFVDYARGAAHDRLAHALRQLIDGVAALHLAGKLHRDIKPSNVLVTLEGRVVILDFGLIAELLPQRAGDVNDAGGGTPAYMAPEARSGAPPSEASDWYGVGITLYEALTGSIPVVGTFLDVALGMRTDDPPTPAQMVPDVPADLSTVCMGLLRRNPEQRLSGPEALRGLARETAPSTSKITPAAIRDTPFVGRDRQLHVLNNAFLTVMNGGAAAVSVCGPSGIGKSALVRRFLSRFGMRDDVVVLSGRCYENESVPYKALDGVVDDVSRYLASIPRQHVERLLPPDVPALTQVFPVLLQVGAIEDARRDQELGNADPLGLRRRAFRALRELLGRLAERQSLMVYIDDLHWADADSVVLLEELLRPPRPPAMLTVVCFRSEETGEKPFLQALLVRAGFGIWSAISLEPMTEDEAHTLIGALLPTNSTLTVDDKKVMSREASGSPFVLEQLARYAGVKRQPSQSPTFAEMFATRLAALSPEARRFLETLAICGRPMAPELVCDACGVARERQSLVAMLRSSHFIRSSGSAERIETYHDRIREALAAELAPDAVRAIHRLIVQALVDKRTDDCEALFEHYLGAGEREPASIQASAAATKAAGALAFDRAAFYYRQALALTPDSTMAETWKEGLATALANAGRPAEAAEACLRVATGANHPRRVEFQRRAAEQFLIGGHIDRGLDLIRTMLAGMGVRVPRSPRSALLWLLWRRARLRWRGLGFVPTPEDEIDPDTLLRVDTCWSAATGLALVDMISASEFSVHDLLMALDAGEPDRIARAMAMESAARGAYPTGRKLSDRLFQQSKALARGVGNPHAIGLSILADALIASTRGEWKKAGTLSEQALAILRDQCVGVTWELSIAQNVVIWSLMYRGELRELCRQVPPLLANARSSGNLYIATELCTRSNYVWLTADDPDEGERETIDSIAQWSQKGFHRQHYSAMLARVQTALYRGDGEAAWRLLAEQQSRLRRSLLTRVQVIRIESFYLRARAALAMASSGSPRRFVRVARAGARRIARERMPWSNPISLLLRAGIAHLEGQGPLTLSYLHDAADRFDRADMKLYAAVARRRIGALQDDAPGRELQRQAEDWMAAQHIRNPAAFTRMLAPGFPGLP